MSVVVGSAVAGSVLVWRLPCNCQPAKFAGRMVAGTGSFFAPGAVAKTNAERKQARKVGMNRRRIMGATKRAGLCCLLDYKERPKVSTTGARGYWPSSFVTRL